MRILVIFLVTNLSFSTSVRVSVGNDTVKKETSCEGYKKNGSTWLDTRQARAIWLKRNVRGADINLNKAGKAHDNAFAT